MITTINEWRKSVNEAIVPNNALEVGKCYKCYDTQNGGALVHSSIKLDAINDETLNFIATQKVDRAIEIPKENAYTFVEIPCPVK